MHIGGKSLVYFSSGVLLPDEVAELRGSEVFSDALYQQGSGAAQRSTWSGRKLVLMAVLSLALG